MVSDNKSNKSTVETVRKVLAADLACEENDLIEEGVTFCRYRKMPGARRFPIPDKYLIAVTMGTGVVVSCSPDRLRWAKANMSKSSRDEIFGGPVTARVQKLLAHDGQYLAGLQLGYIYPGNSFRAILPPGGIEITVIEKDEIPGYYEDTRFRNALGYGRYPDMPDMIAALATCDGEPVGMAAASADSDAMWQIGVDTLPDYRRRGIARAMVGLLTEIIMSRGIVPYYMTGVTNIISRRTAVSLGYRPAWVSFYSRDPQHDVIEGIVPPTT